jgi:hypothetical protein
LNDIVFTPEPEPTNVRCFFCRRRAELDSGFFYCPGCDETFIPTYNYPDPSQLVEDVARFVDKSTPTNKRLMALALDDYLVISAQVSVLPADEGPDGAA